MNINLVLASGSPRRMALLHDLGWSFSIDVPRVDEQRIAGEKPENMVCRLAELKAEDVSCRYPLAWVVAADTVVVMNEEILGKPNDYDDAVRMVMMLQGEKHTVMTGVALFAPDGRKLVAVEKTVVKFREMTRAEVLSYVDTGESLDKAGAYAIQEHGSLIVESIEGCFFNVVGLPLGRLSAMFSDMGWPLSEQWRV